MKRLLSYLLPTSGEQVKPSILPGIEVNINNGKVHIDGQYVNYSFGSLHHVFRKAIRYKSEAISQANNALILGFGAGSIAKILWNEKGYKTQITGVDYEPLMFELAEKYGNIKQFNQIQCIQSDAAAYLQACKDQFDVVFVDLFVEREVPSSCLNAKFMNHLKACLNQNGLIVWNNLIDNDLKDHITSLANKSELHTTEAKQITRDNLVLYIS